MYTCIVYFLFSLFSFAKRKVVCVIIVFNELTPQCFLRQFVCILASLLHFVITHIRVLGHCILDDVCHLRIVVIGTMDNLCTIFNLAIVAFDTICPKTES